MHLPMKGFVINRAHWSRDGKQIFVSASEPGHASRIYRLGLEGGTPQPLSPEGVIMPITGVSPDGKYLPGVELSSNRTLFFPTSGGAPAVVPGLQPDERIANWTADGMGIFAYQIGIDKPFPVRIYRVDRKTGRRQLQVEIAPGDRAGVVLGAVRITPDGKSYAYTADQGLAVLHAVDGLK